MKKELKERINKLADRFNIKGYKTYVVRSHQEESSLLIKEDYVNIVIRAYVRD